MRSEQSHTPFPFSHITPLSLLSACSAYVTSKEQVASAPWLSLYLISIVKLKKSAAVFTHLAHINAKRSAAESGRRWDGKGAEKQQAMDASCWTHKIL